MSQQLDNIRAAYDELEGRVCTALQTQLGDAYRLERQRDEVLRLAAAVAQVYFSITHKYILSCFTAPRDLSCYCMYYFIN